MANQTTTNQANESMENMATAITLIQSNKAVPKQLQDEFEIFSMFEENNKFEELSDKTVQPIMVWFNEESYKDGETGEIEDDVKTYLLCQDGENFKIYSGFSVTMRIKLQLLLQVFKNNLPKIAITKVSKGMKQEYSVKPIKG